MSEGGLIRQQVIAEKRQRLFGEVVLRDNMISSRMVVGIVIICAIAIGWAVTATYPRTETVRGIVVPNGPAAKIMAQRPGITEQVFVREGASVRRGQPLAYISVETRDSANRGTADENLAVLDAQSSSARERLAATEAIGATEQDRLAQALASSVSEQSALENQRALQRTIIASKVEELERIEPVVTKGFVSRLELDRRRQSLLIERQRLDQLSQQIIQLDSRRAELRMQLRRLPSERLRQQAEIKEQIGALSLQQSRARIEIGYTIVAPIDGRVTAMQISPGRAVDGRLPVMAIVPHGDRFRTRLFANSRAIGFLRPGQEARISFDAFPYKQFGTFKGQILSVSKTAYDPSEVESRVSTDEPVYPIEVGLVATIVANDGRPLPLQAGMSVSANVILERRSFLDWLMQPLNAVRNRT